MSEKPELLMLSAMYENGGNLTHRLLDGHPDLFVYPFESQLGTRFVNDGLSSLYPVKYRWPEFRLDGSPDEDYDAIIDEECRVRARTPAVSKFGHVRFDFSDDERRSLYLAEIAASGRGRAQNVAAFLNSTFGAWTNRVSTGRERIVVGYSPLQIMDADKIVADFPRVRLVQVVRNPWSAFADTKKRPVPMRLADYCRLWAMSQQAALVARELYPSNIVIVRLEDLLADPRAAFAPLFRELDMDVDVPALNGPSWNGQPLEQVYPWGTIRTATAESNRLAAQELSREEAVEIRQRTSWYLDTFDYRDFIG